MERRKFMIGLGSAAAGASALVGSGAVSQMSSGDRSVAVEVVDDDEAYIALQPGEVYEGQRNGNFAEIGDNGKLYLDFTSDNPTSARSGDPEEGNTLGGTGVNPQSEYFFDGVFDVVNLTNDTGSGVGEQDIWITKDGLDELTFYHLKSGDRANIEGMSNSVDISPGQDLPIGVLIDASDLDSGAELEGTIQVHSKGGSSTTYGQNP